MSGFNYLDKVLDAVSRVDKEYVVKYFSVSGIEWLGHEKPKAILDIVHLDDHAVFKNTIDNFTEDTSCEIRIHRQGKMSWVEITVLYLEAAKEYVLCIQDISKWKDKNENLIYASEHDVLTGLANRGLLDKVINLAITQHQYTGQKFAVMLLDLDGFKKVNDTLGHNVGDEVLIHTANRLTKIVRNTDLVCRLGGDEFVIVLMGADESVAIKSLASKVLKSISAAYATTKAESVYLSASIGVAVYPENGGDYHVLLKHADIAMYKAKETGKNRYMFFNQDDSGVNTLSLESSMFDGIHEGEFYLLYQPKFCIKDTKIVGCEALMRWDSTKFGKVQPSDFINLAEDNGLITYLGTWALRSACHQLKEFLKIIPDFVMSVNVSSKQFISPEFTKTVRNVLKETGINPAHLVLEITETTLMLSTDKTNKTLMDLKNLGVSFSIDDFGSGFSSLSYLKKFPISELKIDKSFISDLVIDPNDKAIVNAIINMAHSLGLSCVAEGVETQDQFEFLKFAGCDIVQGYLQGKPMPDIELLALLEAK